jgi:redox-sensitive bicupin YhaK (pirin superfamily)
MLTLKPYAEIGGGDRGWLKAKHHFAIGEHDNPAHRPVGNLFVLNDDQIAPGTGFPFHGHANIEIISYVREGAVTHEDSLGNKGWTKAGDVQVMSAGTGIRHAEYNEGDVPTRLFQIWLLPRQAEIAPRWDTRQFPRNARAGHFVTLASGYDTRDALPIHADAEILGAMLPAGVVTPLAIRAGAQRLSRPVDRSGAGQWSPARRVERTYRRKRNVRER